MPQGHLTIDERYIIERMSLNGYSRADIAKRLGCHRGTVCRELQRNRDPRGGYNYQCAQLLADKRRTQASKHDKLKQGPLVEYVCKKLRYFWSPDEISNRLKDDYSQDSSMQVSPETIYKWIYSKHKIGEQWHKQLRHKHPHRKSRCVGKRGENRGKLQGTTSIDERPKSVENRNRFGHWESDTMEGAKGRGLLVTHVERKSKYVRLGKLDGKKSKALSSVTCSILSDLPDKLLKTMTCDNGKEFAGFADIEKGLNLKTYFAHYRAPWERGTNENTNGLLRDWFPKGCDFRKVTHAQLAKVEKMLNNRPRKCLNYRTPAEVLSKIPGVALRN